MALLNNRPWDTEDVEQPVVHSLEEWDLVNLTADTHPIHLHLVQFRLRDRRSVDAAGYLQAVFGVPELHPEDVGRGVRPFPPADGFVSGPAVGPSPFEDGWKDTVQAHPGMVTRIVVPFGAGASAQVPFGQRTTFTGEYVWHCHILDHEDNEMMLPYRVVPE
jgi:FtsP/CotA-like multicopper oxidase with cupredoxin domain